MRYLKNHSYFDLLNRPIFLHFLNREICETENVQFSDDELYGIVLMAILSTTSYVYIGHAIVIENAFRYPKTTSLLMEMEKFGYVCLIGNDFNITNFIRKRQELYKQEKKKYRMYFENCLEILPWPKNLSITYLNTTDILFSTFIGIANDLKVDDEYMGYKLSSRDKILLGKRMEYQKETKIAVTKKLFSKSKISNEGKESISRLVIQIYNKRYCDEFDGICITGIPGLTYYDKFQVTNLYYNYIIIREILRELKIFSDKFYCSNDRIMSFRECGNFKTLLMEIRKFLTGVTAMQYSCSNLIIFIRNILSNKFNKMDSCENLIFKLWSVSEQLSKEYDSFKMGYGEMIENYKKILIISASVLEYKILRKCAINKKYMFVDKDTNLEDYSYAECLPKGGVKIFLARTDVGSLNASHTIEVLSKCIKPDFVMVGGICVGLRKKEQKISQLLISTQIHDYALQKVTNGNKILRGTTINANRYLYDKCILECYDMEDGTYDYGLILSADILVNDKGLIHQMIIDKPDAIGYEMEGSGLSYICNIFNNRWIMVKAISDWGFNKCNNHQEEAALKSYEFIFNVIEKRIKL